MRCVLNDVVGETSCVSVHASGHHIGQPWSGAEVLEGFATYEIESEALFDHDAVRRSCHREAELVGAGHEER